MNTGPHSIRDDISLARLALRRGDRLEARRHVQNAISKDADNEEAWLILAATASPRASVGYIKRALEINPKSRRARKGMHWAVQRLRAQQVAIAQSLAPTQPITLPQTIEGPITPRSRRFAPLLFAALLLTAMITAGWFAYPKITNTAMSLIAAARSVGELALAPQPTHTLPQPSDTPTLTSTQTATDSPTPTDTLTPTPTATPPPTETPTPTATNTATFTPTLPPTASFTPTNTAKALVNRPPGVDENERWIDIDLSEQRTYAFQGDTLINKFRVSTGTAQHPTVQGKYRIYVKYRSAHMSGPGYYLPNVPYVMYFFKGYGLHGTYWHNNFGHPMSHGCVNLKNEDAAWLFSWASVGTVVFVHP